MKKNNDIGFAKQDEIGHFKNYSDNREARLESQRKEAVMKVLVLKAALLISLLLNFYFAW